MKRRAFCLLALFLLAACEEPAPTLVGTTVGGAVTTAPSQGGQPPATPVPTGTFATPVPPIKNVVATPPAPTPAAPASGSPSPAVSPGANGTPAPPGAATPTPLPSGLVKTTKPGDLAVSGPGYFVLATKPNPVSTADLLFTRNGHFQLKAESAGALPLFRLRHADYGFHVVGYQIAGGTGAGAPAEATSNSEVPLLTTWGGLQTVAQGLYVDADRNPDANRDLSFDYTGRMLLKDKAPRGEDAGPVQAYVAIAMFETPDSLVPAPGFPGIFRYEPQEDENADPVSTTMGVAVSGSGRAVGNTNLVLTGQLESP